MTRRPALKLTAGCVLGFAGCVLDLASCGPSLQEIPRGEHPLSGGAQPIAVDSAPPHAQIDTVTPSPADECAWADGQWRWQDNRWQWESGSWVRVAPSCYYADALMVWVPTQTGKGILFYTHAQWYKRAGGLCTPPTRCL